MSQEWYRDFDRRRSQRVTNQWRSHHQSAGKRQLVAGSVTALVAVGLLILGVNQYVDATYSEPSADPTLGIVLIAAAGVMLVGSAVLCGIGYVKQRRDLKRARTYDDLG